jgi:uncharacterized protein (TIGR02246 family)
MRTEIAACNRRFVAAFGRGDAAALANLYTADAQLLPPHSDAVTGPDAIRAFWQAVIDLGLQGASLETVELEGDGDSAIEIGKFTLRAAEGQIADTGKYLVVWKIEDGAWRLHRDIWNSSRPASKQ